MRAARSPETRACSPTSRGRDARRVTRRSGMRLRVRRSVSKGAGLLRDCSPRARVARERGGTPLPNQSFCGLFGCFSASR